MFSTGRPLYIWPIDFCYFPVKCKLIFCGEKTFLDLHYRLSLYTQRWIGEYNHNSQGKKRLTNSSYSRPRNSFVIFRFGEGDSENVILNLPSVLVNGNNHTGSSTQSSDTDNTQAQPSDTQDTTSRPNSAESTSQPASSQPNSATAAREDDQVQRNMLVSVSYVYSGDGTPRNPTGGNSAQPRDDRSGSILLNVPNIPSNRTETQLNALIEFAASIALSAIHANIRRNHGIKKEAFEKFPVKAKKDIIDKTCPICFDDYNDDLEDVKGKDGVNDNLEGDKGDDDNDTVLNAQGKRRRTDDDNISSRKVRKTGSISHPTHTNGESSASSTAGPTPQSSQTQEEYEHIPVVLPCKHTFGRNCLYEWLKSNSTCPLCRQVVSSDSSSTSSPPEQINIPNITSLLNPTSRDNPMVIVLDRATNTLTTRSGSPNTSGINTNTPEANAAASLVSGLTEPSGIPISGASPPRLRDPLSSSILRGLNQPAFSGLFSSGVASRRTRSGVETVSLDNNNREDFDAAFYDESRRLVEERLRARTLRNQLPQTSASPNDMPAPTPAPTSSTSPNATSTEQQTVESNNNGDSNQQHSSDAPEPSDSTN